MRVAGTAAGAASAGADLHAFARPPAGIDIVVVKDDAKWSGVDLCLRSFPVVFIETTIAHPRIPHDYFPHLLSTGAVP